MKRYLTGSTSRGVLFACALLATGAAPHALAQEPAGPVALPPSPVTPPPAPAGLSESVAAVVNDDIVSTYDLSQRMPSASTQ